MPTIAVDFDGVINPYFKGFQGPGIYEPPKLDMKILLERLQDEGWTIIIFTCRDEESGIRKYLQTWGIPFSFINFNPRNEELGLSRKVVADVYLDDKAITFDGSTNGLFEKIMNFKPYYRRIRDGEENTTI
jgi:hypothetical protein